MNVLKYGSSIVMVFIVLNSVSTKSIQDSDSKFRGDNEAKLYPVKRKSPNYDQGYYVVAHEEQPDIEYSEGLSNADGFSAAQRYRRIDEPSGSSLRKNNIDSLRDYKTKPASLFERQLDLRRQVMDNGLSRRSDRINKRNSEPIPLQSDDAYGMVYRRGRLVGILEPYLPAYELSPLSNLREGIEEIQPLPVAAPSTRQAPESRYSNHKLASDKHTNTDWNSEKGDYPAKYADEKYPMLLTDFKIDSRMSNVKRNNVQNPSLAGGGIDRNEKGNSMFTGASVRKDAELQNYPDAAETKLSPDVKRSATGITNEKISELKSALDRIQNPESSDKVVAIEEDLRNILNDMGLIDNEGRAADSLKNKRNINSQEALDKREVDKEDENLEQGENKIEIVRNTHDTQNSEREKREDNKKSQSSIASNEKLAAQDMLNNDNGLDLNEQKLADDASKLKSEEAELDSEKLNKEDAETAEHQEKPDEKRAASNINVANYQSEGAAYIRNKRQESSTGSADIMKGLEKSGDLTVSGNKSPLASSENCPDSGGEKHSSGSVTSTTSASRLVEPDFNSDAEYQSDIERNLQAKIDAIKEEVKREIAALQAKNVAEKQGKENLRKKRDASVNLVEEETSAIDPQQHPEEKLLPLIRRRRNLEGSKRIKRDLSDSSNLNNVDSAEYAEVNGDQKREERDASADEQLESQSPQNSEEINSDNADNSKGQKDTQQDLTAIDSVNAKVSNQENAGLKENIAKVTERSADASTTANVALPNEMSTKEDNSLSKIQENDVKVVNARTINSAKESRKSRSNDENPNLLDKQGEVSQEHIRSHKNVKAQISSKQMIESVANQHFNEQLKRLNDESRTAQPLLDQARIEKDLMKVNANAKEKQQEVVDSPKNQIQNLQPQSSTDELEKQNENKRSVQDAPTNVNLESKMITEQENSQQTLRRRRQVVQDMRRNQPHIIFNRRKRANAVIPDGNVAYLPYRAEEDDVDDEGDEFDDDGFDDRTARMQKREINYNDNNQFRRSADYDYELPDGYYVNNYQPEQQKNPLARRYVARLNSDLYENPGYAGNYLYHPDAYVRRKRQNFDQMVALHGGGPMVRHIAAIKERNEQHLDEYNKKNFKRNQNREESQNIADLSDTDLFGALPQSYEGELSRFKRVKRVAENVTKG